jgi:outer membrane immunogenic protein
MKKLGILLPLLAGFAATPAVAQNIGLAARVEARVGYDEVRGGIRFQNSTFADDFGISDVNFGLEAGADAHIFSGILVGAYAGIETSNVDGCVENPFSTRSTSRRDTVCVDAGRNLYAGGRVGIPLGDGGLIYGKAGVSRGTFEGSYVVTAAAPGQRVGPVFNGRDTVSGYHFGGGFELGLASNFYVKGEYVHTRYDDAFTALLNTDTADPNPLRRTDRFNPSRHQLVLGIGFRFGGRREER